MTLLPIVVCRAAHKPKMSELQRQRLHYIVERALAKRKRWSGCSGWDLRPASAAFSFLYTSVSDIS
jgi:hypothetical protein